MTGFESLNIIDVNMTNKLESLETFESKEINRSMITPNILRGVLKVRSFQEMSFRMFNDRF